MIGRKIFTLVLAVVVMLALGNPASGALSRLSVKGTGDVQSALPQGVERVASVEGITEYRLSNGLRVLLFPDPSKPTITVNITYLVGSKHENYGETGMAHLLEHLLFKGTPKHPDIYRELTERGGRANGTTWLDRTNYFITFPASEANLEWALELEADRMVNSFIAKKDLDSEMTVVRNEFEAGENSPFNVLLERMLSTAYLWHNYGKSTIGARSDIENVPIERLQAFYRTYYQPDNALLLVAGKIDEARTLELIVRHFGSIPRPARTLPTFYTVEPTQDGERMVTLRRVGDVQLVAACYHTPAGAHPDAAAIDILGHILGDTPSGRLHKALVETKKASRVFGFAFQLREPGVILLGAEVRQDASLDAARETLLHTIEEFTRTPPTAEEVERARTQLLKEIELNLNSPDRVGVELSEWAAMGDWRLLFLHRDRLRQVTPQDVQRVAAAYLKPSNRTLGMFYPTAAPDRAEIPATPDIAALLKDYKGSETVTTGEAFDPSPAAIEARTTRTTLASGLKLALLPKRTRGNAVFATLVFHLGDEKSLAHRRVAGELAAAMLMRGTTQHTRQQIQDEFDRLKARVVIGGGPTGVRASVETIRENLPAVLRLVAEVLREPAFPASEFDLLKQEMLANLEQQRSEPVAIAVRALRRHLGPYPPSDVRYVPTLDESIEEIKRATLEDVKAFYSDFYGGQYGEVAVVGDFDDQKIRAHVEELFGSWKNPRPYRRIVNVYREVPAINQSFETPDKANAFFVAGLNLNLRQDDPDYPALVLGNYLLGGGWLNSRLAMRLRQKEGLSYGVGSQLQADPLDKTGVFVSFAIYAPQNVARLESAYKEEIERALRDGFTEEEIKTAKTGWMQAQEVSRAQDGELVEHLATSLFLDRTLAWDAALEKKIMALTPEEIVAALRRHIVAARISIFKAGDFAKAAKSEAKK
jgi:zinc protease